MSVIVIGDLIFDHYIYGNVNKIANEAPIPVLLQNNEKWNLGGCGNVALNVCSLMDFNKDCLNDNKVHLLSVSGENVGEYLSKINMNKNLNLKIIASKRRKNTIKHRFYNHNYLMFRYDEEEVNFIDEELENLLFKNFEGLLNSQIHSVIFSDYNKGVLTPKICSTIIEICNARNIPTIVDPKNNFEKYKNCTVIKPNLNEAKNFLTNLNENFNEDLSKILNEDLNKILIKNHKVICEKINSKYSMITLSNKGLSLFDSKNYMIYSSNVESKEVIDVTGAGDVVNAILGYYWNKISFSEIARISNTLATISVQHSGSYVITQNDISSVHKSLNIKNKLITFEELNFIDRSNKKLVFTNGCFDLLHIGHLESLKFAKNQGDILVVGLNSDESVKKLKGETRPIHNQDTRSQILGALELVDYVIIFNEETPLKIIEYLKPDCLVKGSDYEGKKVIGSEFCKELKLFEYIEGNSTTETIYKLITSI